MVLIAFLPIKKFPSPIIFCGVGFLSILKFGFLLSTSAFSTFSIEGANTFISLEVGKGEVSTSFGKIDAM